MLGIDLLGAVRLASGEVDADVSVEAVAGNGIIAMGMPFIDAAYTCPL